MLRNVALIYLMLALISMSTAMQKARMTDDETSLYKHVTADNITCVACPPGTFEKAGGNCTKDCDAGFCPEILNCTHCKAGTYNPSFNATTCPPCESGFFSTAGSTNCTACDAGFQSNKGRSACVPCQAGFYSLGGTPCFACDPGYFSRSTQSSCTICPQGTFNSLSGQGSCTPCGKGFFGTEYGLTTSQGCQVCPLGYYCPNEATPVPLECPMNTYCPSGSVSPSSCLTLFESEALSGQCSPSWIFYIAVVGGGVILIIIFSVIVHKIRTRKVTNAQSSYKNLGATTSRPSRVSMFGDAKETDPLIPPPKVGEPTYTGL